MACSAVLIRYCRTDEEDAQYRREDASGGEGGLWSVHRHGTVRLGLEALIPYAADQRLRRLRGSEKSALDVPRRSVVVELEAMHRLALVPHTEVVAFVRNYRLQGRGIGWIDARLLASALVANVPFGQPTRVWLAWLTTWGRAIFRTRCSFT
jgi:hypothetical protein